VKKDHGDAGGGGRTVSRMIMGRMVVVVRFKVRMTTSVVTFESQDGGDGGDSEI